MINKFNMMAFATLMLTAFNFSAAFAASGAPVKELQREFPRLRGFDVRYDANETTMRDVRAMGANCVRLMLRPSLANQKDQFSGWNKILANLPAQLDAARANNLYVVASLFGTASQEKYPKDPEDIRVFLHKYWTNPESLESMTQQAVETAKVLKPYEKMAWLELKNEPLDWRDYPKPPKIWAEWAQKIVTEVRKESDITIVVQVGPGGLCWGFSDFPKLEGGNIVYSVHNYQPHAYSHQGIKNLEGTDILVPYENIAQTWPGKFSDGNWAMWDKERLRKELSPAIEFSKKNNVRIYVGEFGVSRWAPNAEGYIRDNIELFEELGWDWNFHAFRESHIFSVEHDTAYSNFKNAQLSKTETPSAKVLKEYFKLNQCLNNPEAQKQGPLAQ